MSVTAWVLWFIAQIIAFVAIMSIAVLGVTGHLTRTRPARRPGERAPRISHRHHVPFHHRPAH